jgi:hypothetical protein
MRNIANNNLRLHCRNVDIDDERRRIALQIILAELGCRLLTLRHSLAATIGRRAETALVA